MLSNVLKTNLLRVANHCQAVRTLQTAAGTIVHRRIYNNNFATKQLLDPGVGKVPQVSLSFSQNHCHSVQVADYDEIKNLPNHPEVLLVDVREPEELVETGKIPTSINIPLAVVSNALTACSNAKDFEAKYGRKKPDYKTELIFSCLSGKRSRKAAESALALGFQNVKSYDGSWKDWAKHEGLPV